MSKRWKVFTVLSLMFLIGFFYRVSMAVVARDLAADLKLTAPQLGTLAGVFFYVFAFTQIPLGPLLDRFSARVVLSCFGVATTCGAAIFALAPEYHVALLGRVLLGMGTSSILMSSLKIFTNWFSAKEFPAVSGYLAAAGNIGNVIATAPLAFSVSRFGWRYTFLAAALVQIAITAAVYLVVRDAPEPGKAETAGQAAAPTVTAGIWQNWKVILGTPAFWYVAMIAFFWYANYMVLLSLWGGPYLREVLGLDRNQAGNILLCTSFGFIVGSFFQGRIIERVFKGGLERTILSGQALVLVAMTAMLGPAESMSRPMLGLVFCVLGFASSTGVIIYPMARNLVPNNLAATAMTCVNFFLLMGAAVGQNVLGLYIGSFPRGAAGYPPSAYHGAFLMPICGLALVILLFALARKRGRVSEPC